MVKLLKQLYPLGLNIFIQNNSACLAVVRSNLLPYIHQTRGYAGKEEKPSDPAKEEEITAKMPGFIHPENLKEEGYFTQKAKKQLEELKRKESYPADNPDKKL